MIAAVQAATADAELLIAVWARVLLGVGPERRLGVADQHSVPLPGLEALARLRRGPPPDLAIVDCIMPGLTGADVCAALTRDGVGVPVLLMTALADPSFAVHPEWASVLNKPILEEDLLAEIDAQLRPRSGPRSRRPGTDRSRIPA